ncbi:hypothetical protein PNA2_1686 [Pyrococcus sp. NA2]|uniref:tRNA-binding protein Pbp11 n=1 Tax=Pyrococcus sp. (strain NA2) TaxID=342949 RepID=UPI000209AAA7|nr:tRNA-binding protein Pbp11 [Pyrococcus sp. NA2]AEC52601.1 hypothetical protein PNA2_1686 [Pyrococcus sp. NA2]
MFWRKGEKPVGSIKVEKKLKVLMRTVIVGEVTSGIVKVGYKVRKGRKSAGIMKIEKEHKEVEFAIPGDKIAIMLEKDIGTREGDILEVTLL